MTSCTDVVDGPPPPSHPVGWKEQVVVDAQELMFSLVPVDVFRQLAYPHTFLNSSR